MPVNGGDDTELVIDLLDCILNLAIEYRAVGDDDDAAKDGIAIVPTQFHKIMGSP